MKLLMFLGIYFFFIANSFAFSNSGKPNKHQSRVYKHVDNKTIAGRPDSQSKKGNLYLQISFPYVNNFLLKPDYESYKSNTGFLGISGGLDYFHKNKQFVNISASGVMNFFLPFPAPVHYGGEREHMFSSFISLSNNHKINWLTLGYGFSYTSNTWNFIYHGPPDSLFPPTRDPAYRTNKAIGLVFPVHLEFPNGFYTGVIYRPTFIRFSEVKPLAYEHLISWNFGFRIPLYGNRKAESK